MIADTLNLLFPLLEITSLVTLMGVNTLTYEVGRKYWDTHFKLGKEVLTYGQVLVRERFNQSSSHLMVKVPTRKEKIMVGLSCLLSSDQRGGSGDLLWVILVPNKMMWSWYSEMNRILGPEKYNPNSLDSPVIYAYPDFSPIYHEVKYLSSISPNTKVVLTAITRGYFYFNSKRPYGIIIDVEQNINDEAWREKLYQSQRAVLLVTTDIHLDLERTLVDDCQRTGKSLKTIIISKKF